jgi:5'-deoxynucleotidase YfbR-like HD superfamily hydrolase
MPENVTKDMMKTIKKEIKELRKKYKKIEVRPCQNDAELLLKDSELKEIMEKIYALEQEKDRLILNFSRVYPDKST